MGANEDCGCGCGGDCTEEEQQQKEVLRQETRRQFLKNLAILSTGIVAGSLSLIEGSPAHADPPTPHPVQVPVDGDTDPVPLTKDICQQLHDVCLENAALQPTEIQRAYAIATCWADYGACLVAAEAQALAKALKEAAQWIIDHATAIVGTFVVIAGILFVVAITGGGALVLVLA